jgi:predicted RNA-binding Zn-ribbon protein involved in translation (DUF1610 family)
LPLPCNETTEELNTTRQPNIQKRMGEPSTQIEVDDVPMGEIRIDLQKGVCMPGEEIHGNVQILIDKPISQRSVMLYLIGKERTQVSYTTTTGSGKNARRATHTAVEESAFLHQEAPLPLPVDEKGKLKPGAYSIPFKFALPDGVPVTYVGQHARILYEVNAKIDVPMGFDVNESSQFEVISNPQGLFSERTDVCSEGWSNPDSAGLNVSLERCMFERGEVLSGKCAFRNPHSKNLRKIDVDLTWIETARAQGHGATAEVAKQSAEVPVGGRLAKGDDSFGIQIPQGAPLTFDASLCSVRCVLHVGLDIAFGSDVEANRVISIVGSMGQAKGLPVYAAARPGYTAKSIPEKAFQPASEGQAPVSMFCQHCGTAIRIPYAKYCPACGWRLDTQAKQMTPMGTQPQMKIKKSLSPTDMGTEDCIVCRGELSQDDDVVWCPHCGKLAHREHMMEWIRGKGTCPACGKSLNEEYYK